MLLNYYLIVELLSQLALHAPKDVPELETIFNCIPGLPLMPLGDFSGFLRKLDKPNNSGPASTRHVCFLLCVFVCQKQSLHVHKHTHMSDSLQVHKLIHAIMCPQRHTHTHMTMHVCVTLTMVFKCSNNAAASLPCYT
jgi:hypothetical protein